jgi:hypothetical protein
VQTNKLFQEYFQAFADLDEQQRVTLLDLMVKFNEISSQLINAAQPTPSKAKRKAHEAT